MIETVKGTGEVMSETVLRDQMRKTTERINALELQTKGLHGEGILLDFITLSQNLQRIQVEAKKLKPSIRESLLEDCRKEFTRLGELLSNLGPPPETQQDSDRITTV